MPVAIDFSTWLKLQPLLDPRLEFYSENFKDEALVNLNSPPTKARGHWSDYPIGVAVMLIRAGYKLNGGRFVINGEVPIGSGLSSSAALEVATAIALVANSNLQIERVELAKLCRQAENEFVGARVGIMDQFVSLFGEADRALLLDCRSLEFRLLPLSNKTQLVICNTMVKHELASSAYNERRAQCEDGVARLSAVIPGVKALRDVSSKQLEQHKDLLPPIIYKRCRHIVTENERVLAAADALEESDLTRFGLLMNESHRSLRDDYEVSCAELDLMVELAGKCKGVYGARMTGGGFGGCTVNVVEREHVPEFKEAVGSQYEESTRLQPEIYVCNAVKGAEEVVHNSAGKTQL